VYVAPVSLVCMYVCMYVCRFVTRGPYSLSSHEARLVSGERFRQGRLRCATSPLLTTNAIYATVAEILHKHFKRHSISS